jgi:AraC-type DNA-binding domain-containing proteins
VILLNYKKTHLKSDIVINEIVSIHYFEFAKDYVFEGESHDFWEFVYVDKGEVEVMSDVLGFKLRQGEVIFHKPNEFHNLWANGRSGLNLIVVSFCCASPAMAFFKNKIFSVSDYEKQLLTKIILEAKDAFSSALYISSLPELGARKNAPFGCEQLIKLYLEEFLICLIRNSGSVAKTARLSSSVKERSDNDIVNRVIRYLTGQIYSKITFEDVCGYAHMSKTNLKELFKAKTNQSVMEYYRNLRIEEAKRLIREENINFTQIADKLGYSSICYFSRQFKSVTDMTLSEYSHSAKLFL